MKILQNFYKSTLSLDWSVGIGTFYVTIKPTITDGWLVISPNNSSLREIVRYTTTGTDSNGDYVGVTVRGVGGTTEQTHTIGEPIRMNITAEYWNEMNTDIANIVAAGVLNANTTTMGGVEIATQAEMNAGTDIGGTGASVVPTPSVINTKITSITNTLSKIADIQTFTSTGTWTMPAGAKSIMVEAIGGGGGGGGVVAGEGSAVVGGGGGGGGYNKIHLLATQITSPVTVTIPAASAGGTAGAVGTVGGNVTFGTYATGYGGGGGYCNAGSNSGPGGGGGGMGGVGAVGTSTVGGAGGFPEDRAAGVSGYFGGGGGATTTSGDSFYGGGGGGQASDTTPGASIFGGGGGSGRNSGVGGTSQYAGAGGVGGVTNSNGGAGVAPGGGGGGASTTGTNAYNGGAGAKGQIVVTTFF